MPNDSITKSDLKSGLANLRESLESTITANTREIISHFNQSQGYQNERMDKEFGEINAKLDAIMEMLAMRQELRNLIRELANKGITLDESKIFVA